MYTERFSPGFVAGLLMAAAERQRDALGPWSPEVREKLQGVFGAELELIKRAFFELFQDKGYWQRLEALMRGEVFTRYCAAAEKQGALESRNYDLWRGGDAVARGAYALGGLVLGIACVEIKYIPIYWDPFAFVTMLVGPLVPDAQVWWARRKYGKALERIMKDAGAAEQAQALYEPIASAANDTVSPVSSVESAPAEPNKVKEPGGN